MEIGLNFDDDEFKENSNKEQENQSVTPYNVKYCPVKWFAQTEATENDPEHKILIMKCRAEYLYYQQEYHKAREILLEMLDSLPSSNKSLRRDLTETCIRCCVALQLYDEAYSLLQYLLDSGTNADHRMQALLVKADLDEAKGHVTDLEITLKTLICLHTYSPFLWKRLYHLYSKKNKGKDDDDINHRAVTCLIRARLLFVNSMRSIPKGSFVRDRHREAILELDKGLQDSKLSTEDEDKAYQTLGADIEHAEQPDSSSCASEAEYFVEINKKVADFDRHWFTWSKPVI